MNLVSVIIPNYNHAPFLKQRIETVLNQTYQNIEIIILDDASSDNSKDIIETYRHHSKIVHIEYNTKNSGSTFKQWQKGIELAKGDWIWIAESDDYADVSFLETLLSNDLKNNIGFIYCRSNLINEKNEFVDVYGFSTMPDPLIYPTYDKNFYMSGNEFIKTSMVQMNAIPNASSAIFKKQNIDLKIFEYIDQTILFGDWIFWLHLFKTSDIIYINNPLNFFRYHKNTVRKKTENTSVWLREKMLLIKYYEKSFGINKPIIDAFLFHYFFYKSPFIDVSIFEHLKINLFIFKRQPLLLIKTYIKKLN